MPFTGRCHETATCHSCFAVPRRQQLLRTVLRRFEVDVSHADEIAPSWLTPGETAQANAWLKARAVAARHPKALVIGSDTVVALGRRSFGKPADLAQAFGNLKTLSGKTHQVITGVALIQWSTRRCLLQAESTDVHFQKLSAEVIRTYLARIQPPRQSGGLCDSGTRRTHPERTQRLVHQRGGVTGRTVEEHAG